MIVQEIIAYEMAFSGKANDVSNITCIPFKREYFTEYMQIYNECFYKLREELDVKPYNFYSDYSQFECKSKDTFILLENNEIVGAVSCYGNEIDDLIVKKSFQGKGFGRQLLLWGMQYIRQQNSNDIILHVAEWNSHAIDLYTKLGFSIKKKENVR